MVNVKPDEISAILKQQLSGFHTEAELEEVGVVLSVGDGIARVYGLTNAKAGELVEFETGVQAIVLNLEEDNVGVVLLGPSDDLKEGSKVKRTNTILPSRWEKVIWVVWSIRLASQLMARVKSQVINMKCLWSVKLPELFSVSR